MANCGCSTINNFKICPAPPHHGFAFLAAAPYEEMRLLTLINDRQNEAVKRRNAGSQ